MNTINITGNIAQDIELKTTQSGKSVCSFDIAVKRPFVKDTTDFIPCTIWGQRAETFSKYVFKGNRIGITGSLTTRKYQDKNGNNRTAFEVLINDFDFLQDKKSADPLIGFSEKVDSMKEDFKEATEDDSDLPF